MIHDDASCGGGRSTASAAVVAVLVASSLLWLAPAPVAAIETETFRITPSPLVVQGFERRSYAFAPEAGATAGDAVRVTNTSDEPRQFRLYSADAEADPTSGSVTVAPATVEPRGVGSWVELEREELTLDPSQSEEIRFTLNRPRGTSAEGLGAIVVEELLGEVESGGVDVVYRLALLIRLDGDVAGLRVQEPRLAPPVELFPSRSSASVRLTNETLQPVTASVAFTAGGLTGRFWELGEQDVRLDVGETVEVTAAWTTVPRWGGYFQPAASVAWEGGSIVRTGPRALHPPLWLLALVILVVGLRAVRELRTPRHTPPATSHDEPKPGVETGQEHEPEGARAAV